MVSPNKRKEFFEELRFFFRVRLGKFSTFHLNQKGIMLTKNVFFLQLLCLKYSQGLNYGKVPNILARVRIFGPDCSLSSEYSADFTRFHFGWFGSNKRKFRLFGATTVVSIFLDFYADLNTGNFKIFDTVNEIYHGENPLEEGDSLVE